MRALTVVAIVVAAFLALPPAALADSDIEITLFTDSLDPVPEEALVTYHIAVRNNGPDATPGSVTAVVTPPASMFTFDSATASQGTAAFASGALTYSIGSMGSGATVTGESVWKGAHPGTGTTTASADFIGTDPNGFNAAQSEQTTVTGLTASAADFGDQVVGTAGPLVPITFTNGSALAVTVSLTEATGGTAEWITTADCSGQLAPGATCARNFRFLPAALGPRVLHATFDGTGPVDEAPVVDFTGRGIAAPAVTGPIGPQGPAGPAGPAGPPAFKLVVAPVSAKLRARAGKTVTFSYVSTLDASATLDVLKGSKRVARVRGTAKTGMNKLRWNGKVGKKSASAGSYKLRLTAVNGAQTATANAKLTLARR